MVHLCVLQRLSLLAQLARLTKRVCVRVCVKSVFGCVHICARACACVRERVRARVRVRVRARAGRVHASSVKPSLVSTRRSSSISSTVRILFLSFLSVTTSPEMVPAELAQLPVV